MTTSRATEAARKLAAPHARPRSAHQLASGPAFVAAVKANDPIAAMRAFTGMKGGIV